MEKMNNFYKGGGGLCLPPITYGLLLLNFMLFNLSDAWAQSAESRAAEGQEEIKPLLVGDKVPEEFWTKEHLFYVDGDTVRKTLEEYRGKLLILDFWASWCGACLHNFPKLEMLKEEYGDDVNFVLINPVVYRDDLDQLNNTYQMLEKNGGAKLPSIVLDEYFANSFPHVGIPRYTWINAKGRFIASTSNLFVSNGPIEDMLEGKH